MITVFHKTAETFATGAKSLAQRYFVSPEVFAEEQDRIFSKQWVLVGHQNQIAEPGDYFVTEVASESLIIVRDKGGEVHGFYNVCRHRGTRLREDRNGHLSAIQCPYHAWTYGLDGRLIGAPQWKDQVPGFDKADYSLHAVNLGTLGRTHFRESWRRLDTARRLQLIGRLVRAVNGKIFSLEPAETAPGETD